MAGKWTVVGNELVAQLQGVTDESIIKELAEKVVNQIREAYPNVASRKNPVVTIRKTVLTAFPDTETQEYDYQYSTDSGKDNIPRYQHLALKYLTLTKDEWSVLRKEPIKSTEDKHEVKHDFTLQDMNIETLELDADTQSIVQAALEHSGLSLAEFIRKASKVYATTLVGKAKQFEYDLSSVSTKDLLSERYKTHPLRADELTERAIVALERHNNSCTEKAGKWKITQTAIQSLIGSKPATIKAILPKFQLRIDDHNQKHDLSDYQNRKPGKKIEDEINLIELVPFGVD